MNPPPREPVKHWLTVAKFHEKPDGPLVEMNSTHETTDLADKYAESILRQFPDGEVLLFKFEHRYTAKLVIEKDGGRTAT